MPVALAAVAALDSFGVTSRGEAAVVLKLWATLSRSAQSRVLMSVWAAAPPLPAAQVEQVLSCFPDDGPAPAAPAGRAGR